MARPVARLGESNPKETHHMATRLAEELARLREKEITFRAFYSRTREDWQRMAAALYRHWKLPPTVTQDDVEQEMLLAAWNVLPRWDPALAPLDSFVVYAAHDKALKWIHKQRGCNQHTRKGRSEFARCLSMLAKEGAEERDFLERYVGALPADAEHVLDCDAVLGMLPDVAPSEAERRGMKHFIAQGGDLEKASTSYYADEHRRLLGIGNRAQARTVIQGSIRNVRRTLRNNGRGAAS